MEDDKEKIKKLHTQIRCLKANILALSKIIDKYKVDNKYLVRINELNLLKLRMLESSKEKRTYKYIKKCIDKK